MIYWFSQNKNKSYNNKIDALQDADDIEIRLNYEYGFDEYDWTIEPDEDWKTLLREHAKYLRDTNKKIRIWYSGGVDSQTILNTFLENNLHIDEIAVWRGTPTNDFDNAFSTSEVNIVALPFLNSIQKDIPKTKIIVVDLGYEHYYKHINEYFKFSPTFNGVLSVPNIPLYRPDLFSIDDNYINITGLDKPRVFFDGSNYYLQFNDNEFIYENNIPNQCFENYCPFYFSSKKIYAKQSHMLVNYLKTNYNKSTETKIINQLCRDPLIKPYSVKKNLPQSISYFTVKSFSDYEFCQTHPNKKELVDLFNEQIQNINLPLHCFHNNNKYKGLIGHVSKKYKLT